MSIWEIIIIVVLCILLLKPKDIKIIFRIFTTVIHQINKYIKTIKNEVIK